MPAKTALLIDFDNVFSALWKLDRDAALRFASEPRDWLQVLANTNLTGEQRRWLVARCYLNPAGFVNSTGSRNERFYYSDFRPGLVRAGLEVIDCPAVTRQGKNAADIRIVIDVLDLLDHRTHFDEFVLASGDADFTPLLQRIRAEDRRITVVSPSYLASAYTAIADRIVDFDAIAAILNADIEDETPGSLEVVPPAAASAEAPDEEARFAAFITRKYDEANEPLSLAALAFEAARLCPNAKRSEWFGKKTFKAAVASLKLPHLRTSNHHLWHDERHQPPAIPSPAQASNVPEIVTIFMRALDLPRIEQKDWPSLFTTLSAYAAEHHFNLTEATRWTRDTLAEQGTKIARGSVAYVVRGCQFGGAPLDADVAPTADQIGDAFYNALLDRAASLGIQVTPDVEQAIADWLGLGPME